eukprot:TRINITY_DN21889_c0_g1_i1.p1 TRINITY_DN21889_c0_g1~~TRINITY_DN21889_c0_g1_i1.p1  ORF type:complete len:598 (-),score=111.79 TRINITY_DN21889_c0_g1_i1:139-1893(-)
MALASGNYFRDELDAAFPRELSRVISSSTAGSSSDPDWFLDLGDNGEEEESSADEEQGTEAAEKGTSKAAFLLQYFSVGIIYGGLPSTTYGFFLGYLSVPSYVYASVSVMCVLPWSFKFLFGLINDTLPIRGQHRKPYMVIGWAFCATVLFILSMQELPDPYWCVDDFTGEYIKKQQQLSADGEAVPAKPCNPDARKQGGRFTVLMMLAAMGYVIADVAADGLLVQYAKQEDDSSRGTMQANAYMSRTIGSALSHLFVGLCMNSKLYNGSFSWGLSFSEICRLFAIPAATMVPISFFCVREVRGNKKGRMSCEEYMAASWDLLCSKAFFFVVIFTFGTPLVQGIHSTAGGLVKEEWAQVRNFQNQLFSIAGKLLFTLGLWLVKNYFLHVSWRMLLVVTNIILWAIDSTFTTLTIFDVVRNQYFYLGETVLVEIPEAAIFVVTTFVIVEMADDGNEGLVYGILTTCQNLGTPFARALANLLYGTFRPSLSDVENYIQDSKSFRWTVFWSFLLSYGFGVLSLGLLWFLPNQKQEASTRKMTWRRQDHYAWATVLLLSLSLTYSLTVNLLSTFPSTMCLRIVGGAGC